MKTIWLVGAGISRQADYPLVADFLDPRFFERWLIRFEKTKEVKKIFLERVMEHFKKWSEKGNDINALMTYYLNKNDIKAITELSTFILNILDMIRWYYTDESYTPYMTAFAELLCSTNSSVITFNYDTLIEEQISLIYKNSYIENKSNEEIIPPYNLGLSKKFCMNAHNSNFLLDFGSGYLPSRYPTSQGVKLLKIHGSICLMYCTECCMSIYIPPPNKSFSILAADISQAIGQCPVCKRKTEFNSLFVPPASDTAFPVQKLLDSLWEQAEQELKSATNLIISGYSLPLEDKRAFDLLKTVSEANSNLKVLVVDPFLGEKSLKRFSNIFPDLLFLRKNFKDLISIISALRTKFSKSCENLLIPEVFSFLNAVVSTDSQRSKCLIPGTIPINKDPIEILYERNPSYTQQILAITMLSLSENKEIRQIIKNFAFDENAPFRGHYVSAIGAVPDQLSLDYLTELFLDSTFYLDKLKDRSTPQIPVSISSIASAGIRQIAYNAPDLDFELALLTIGTKVLSNSSESFNPFKEGDMWTIKILENLDVFRENTINRVNKKKITKKLVYDVLKGNDKTKFICHICGQLYEGTPYTFSAINKFSRREHTWKNLCNHCHLYLREQIKNNENYL